MAIIYLHGLNSSPASSKCVALGNHCAEHGIPFRAPLLPHMPVDAKRLVEALVSDGKPHLAVGSSMGGYYATWLCERFPDVHAVLINPAVRIAELLRGEVGRRQKNYHNGEEYDFTQKHISQFAAMEVKAPLDPSKYLLLVQTGDEVLDYREAVAFYAGCDQVVEEGGDHSFTQFDRHMPRIRELAASVGAHSA